MRGNYSAVVAAPPFASTIQADMAAFDQLSPQMRAFLNEMPFRQSAEQALTLERQLGRQAALKYAQQTIAHLMPGWEPIRNDVVSPKACRLAARARLPGRCARRARGAAVRRLV